MISQSIEQWVRKISMPTVLVASDRDLSVSPLLFGEDYYMSIIINELRKCGLHLDIAVYSNKKIELNKTQTLTDISQAIEKRTSIILHNVSPIHIIRAKIFKKAKVIMPLYYFWNNSLSLTQNVKGLVGDLLWQPLIDEFIISSPGELSKFKRIGLAREVSVVNPSYSCPHCSFAENLKKKKILDNQLPSLVNAVYIGSLTSKRFPMERVIAQLNSDLQREWHLNIYTTSQAEPKSFKVGNVEVTLIKKALTEKEKCRVLQDAQVFLAPAKNTTMQPPLSVMEAEYHGNLIISTDIQ